MIKPIHAGICLAVAMAGGAAGQTAASGFQSSDHFRLRSIGDVQLSPDGSRIVYTVQGGRQEASIYDVASGRSTRLETGEEGVSEPRWSPDGKWIACFGDGHLYVAGAAGSNRVAIAPVSRTNHPLPSTGERLAWSPDGKRIAFVSATAGPETEAAAGDPMVITRYLYKPTASEGLTRFNDNRRLHIFVADVATRQVRQLTEGTYYEHSVDWSPDGEEILFVSNRQPDPDRAFNYDVFAIKAGDGSIRRVTRTENVEYRPRWSPDGKKIVYQGTKRGLTSSETTMEDTHIWVMDADGSNRRELGAAIDNRQGAPEWSADGTSVYFPVQVRGNVRLYRQALSGGPASVVVEDTGAVGAWSAGRGDALAYAFSTPRDLAQLYLKSGAGAAKQITDLNAAVMRERQPPKVEAVTFASFDGQEVEGFLTHPHSRSEGSVHPLIVMIKGGPHGQQGPAFNLKAAVYAAQGWAVLMVNYRGSTGYGQKFTDGIFRDQDGGEAKDVLYGVNAMLSRYGWLDPDRLGVEGVSYGGQLTNWLITQTNQFRAAIPIASISNLVSFHYMAYYHDYLAVEFGAFPHQENLADLLWERSPLRYAYRVKTPAMIVHGENDNDVPIGEAEQFYIALKDAGVETVMVRYPREGHGVREAGHVPDLMERSIAWYRKHFASGAPRPGGSQ